MDKTLHVETIFQHISLTGSRVCDRNWHLPASPKVLRHPARFIKEGAYVDLSMDTMHLKEPWDIQYLDLLLPYLSVYRMTTIDVKIPDFAILTLSQLTV